MYNIWDIEISQNAVWAFQDANQTVNNDQHMEEDVAPRIYIIQISPGYTLYHPRCLIVSTWKFVVHFTFDHSQHHCSDVFTAAWLGLIAPEASPK